MGDTSKRAKGKYNYTRIIRGKSSRPSGNANREERDRRDGTNGSSKIMSPPVSRSHLSTPSLLTPGLRSSFGSLYGCIHASRSCNAQFHSRYPRTIVRFSPKNFRAPSSLPACAPRPRETGDVYTRVRRVITLCERKISRIVSIRNEKVSRERLCKLQVLGIYVDESFFEGLIWFLVSR